MESDPELVRIREYLQQQAAKLDIEALIARVEDGIQELETEARAVAPEARAAVPAGDSWSPGDCMQHALGSNIEVARQVLFAAHTGDAPPPEEPSLPEDVDALLTRHRDALDSLYEHVRAADPENYLYFKWEHPFFGDLNWREWLLFLRVHSKDHARQLAAMRAALA
jgi:hypothetical protein